MLHATARRTAPAPQSPDGSPPRHTRMLLAEKGGRLALRLVMLFCLLVGSISAADAEFLRVGPVGFGGYPAWYQDTTGLGMEFCNPLTASELNGGWCLLLPGDTAAPEVFPSAFFDEHFYWAASADAGLPGGKALLTLALEGAFAAGPVIPGDQMVFGRLRILIRPLPASGDYTVYTPFGKYVFPAQVAGDRLFFTEDIGIQCPPGQFDCALTSKIGPFLVPSAVPGGPEMPPVTAANPTPDTDPTHFGGVFAPTAYPGTGKSYVADPARVGPVTGSTLPPYVVGDGTTRNPNIFRIEGPGGLVLESVNFGLMGRVFQGGIPSQVTVDRATYTRTAAGQRVDVFATGLPGTQARIPAGPAPVAVTPQLQYYDAPCVPNLDATGTLLSYSAPAGAPVQMLATGPDYWGQSQPGTIPSAVCAVQVNAVNAAGQTFSAFFPTLVSDQVYVTEAYYDPATQSLSIKATSSDQLAPPTLTAGRFGTLTGGALVVPRLVAPPATVRVSSSARGASTLQVSSGVGAAGPGATAPVASNDLASLSEDSAGISIAVLANDTLGGASIPAGALVTLVASPRLGTATVNPDGTIRYAPAANANGTDSFTYQVTVNGVASNIANVTLTIAPVNDPPVAAPDSFTAIAGVTTTLGVTANDTDPDGTADIVAVANLSLVTPAAGTLGTATATALGTGVSFRATAAGIYAFTYQARDAAGSLSNPTTVTVTVASAETVAITQAEFRTNGGRYRVSGTVAPAAGQTMTIQLLNAAGTVLRTDQVASAAGAWTLDLRNIALPAGANRVRATSSNGGTATAGLTVRN